MALNPTLDPPSWPPPLWPSNPVVSKPRWRKPVIPDGVWENTRISPSKLTVSPRKPREFTKIWGTNKDWGLNLEQTWFKQKMVRLEPSKYWPCSKTIRIHCNKNMFLPVSISDTLGKYCLIFKLLSQDNSNAHSWDVQRKRCISICTLSDRLQQCDDRHHVPTWQKHIWDGYPLVNIHI